MKDNEYNFLCSVFSVFGEPVWSVSLVFQRICVAGNERHVWADSLAVCTLLLGENSLRFFCICASLWTYYTLMPVLPHPTLVVLFVFLPHFFLHSAYPTLLSSCPCLILVTSAYPTLLSSCLCLLLVVLLFPFCSCSSRKYFEYLY